MGRRFRARCVALWFDTAQDGWFLAVWEKRFPGTNLAKQGAAPRQVATEARAEARIARGKP
jgi:hypothetical protein